MTEKILTPVKAIRAKCIDCCGGFANEVKVCGCPDCSLYPYRLGKKPNSGKARSPAQIAATQNLILRRKMTKRNEENLITTPAEGNYTSEQ